MVVDDAFGWEICVAGLARRAISKPFTPVATFAGRGWMTHPSSKPSANDTAVPASFIFRAVNREIRPPILLLGTVWRLSKFTAQVVGNPSSSVKTTSVGILRIVEVMGATVTECSTTMAESRVRISTGRFLSGALNVYQQTS